MRMEKINESQVRFMLNSQDLKERNLTLKTLKYGSSESRQLFQDMLKQASDRYGFNEEQLPLMVEAIPLSAEELLIIISVVEDADELDPHFARFAPQQDPAVQDASNVKGSSFLDTERAEDQPEVFLMRFDSLDALMDFSTVNADYVTGKTLLYRPEEDSAFYLALYRADGMSAQDYLKYLNSLREYGELLPESRPLYAYFREHLEPVMTDPVKIFGAAGAKKKRGRKKKDS